jgi:hypothetical protein
MSKYADLKGLYPEDLTLDEMRTILHISKRKASYMLKNGYIPCKDSGKKTRNFRVKLKDVISYLEEMEEHPEKYVLPSGTFSSATPHQHGKEAQRLPVEEFHLWLEDEWSAAPDAMTKRKMAQLTGYSDSAFQDWISTGKLRCVLLYNQSVTAKVWLIDFYCHDGYLIIHKSKKHQKLLNRFFEEYHGETARR